MHCMLNYTKTLKQIICCVNTVKAKLAIVNQWITFTMLVNVRLSYILVDGYHYSSCGQVILTISLLASLHFRQTQNYTQQQRQNKTVQDFHYYNVTTTSEQRPLVNSDHYFVFHIYSIKVPLNNDHLSTKATILGFDGIMFFCNNHYY